MEPLPWYRIAAAPAVVLAVAAFAAWRPNVRARAAVLGCGAMAAFGMAMDQASARLCPEYFTVLHNPVPGLAGADPTLVGLVWGFLGASGGGLAFGYAAGLAATLGPRPPLTVRDLRRPFLLAVAGMAVAVALVGGIVWHNAGGLRVQFDPAYGIPIPPERHRAALTVACYHMAAYASAVVASIAVCVWVGTERARRWRATI